MLMRRPQIREIGGNREARDGDTIRMAQRRRVQQQEFDKAGRVLSVLIETWGKVEIHASIICQRVSQKVGNACPRSVHLTRHKVTTLVCC